MPDNVDYRLLARLRAKQHLNRHLLVPRPDAQKRIAAGPANGRLRAIELRD
jgi:hypothetical protein